MMNLNYLHSTHKKFLIVSMLLMAILLPACLNSFV